MSWTLPSSTFEGEPLEWRLGHAASNTKIGRFFWLFKAPVLEEAPHGPSSASSPPQVAIPRQLDCGELHFSSTCQTTGLWQGHFSAIRCHRAKTRWRPPRWFRFFFPVKMPCAGSSASERTALTSPTWALVAAEATVDSLVFRLPGSSERFAIWYVVL